MAIRLFLLFACSLFLSFNSVQITAGQLFSSTERDSSCNQADNGNLLIVSTIDGRLSALEPHSGKVIWSVRPEPSDLFSSSLTKLETQHHGKRIRLVPSLDGSIFKFDGQTLKPLPVSAQLLLQSSHKIGDNLMIIGGKEITGYGINLHTGELCYRCSSKGCEQSFNVSDGEDVLVIERHTQTVRAVNSRNGDNQWNFKVSEHRVSISKGYVNDLSSSSGERVLVSQGKMILPTDSSLENPATSEVVVKVAMMKGFIGVVDQQTKLFRWTQQLSSPIVDVWQIKEETVVTFDLFHEEVESMFPSEKLSSHPLLLVGVYEDKLYVKKSNRGSQNKLAASGKKTHWLPLPLAERNPQLIDTIDNIPASEPRAVMLRDFEYPYEGGVLFYERDPDVPRNLSWCPVVKSRLKSLNESLFVAWNEGKEVIVMVFLLMLLCIVITAMLCQRLVKRKVLLAVNQALPYNLESSDVAVGNTKLFSDLRTPPRENNYETSSSALHAKANSEYEICQQKEYVSRYLTDFVPITCLGRGGHGVVFEAKNKIDECSYAVKRIKLSHKNIANERIMREVKALAKLEHSGIVRYFNSWVEKPPLGWQDALDKIWESESSLWVSESSGSFSQSKMSIEKSPFHKNAVGNPFRPFDSEIFHGDMGFNSHNLSSANVSNQSTKTESKGETCKDVQGLSNSKPTMYLYIQMQLCRKESLKDWLLCHDNVRDRHEILDIFHQIVCAVEYVHECGLMHRDLKPSNIFFSMDGVVKIGDFGLVTSMLHDDEPQNKGRMSRRKKRAMKYTDQVGTELYMSPEQVKRLSYNQKVDIFSLGMILFELLVPFTTQTERSKVLSDVKKQKFPLWFQNNYKVEHQLVSTLLSKNPEARPTVNEIKKHQLLEEFEQVHVVKTRKRTSSYTVLLSEDK